jgi:hypothetical protein
MFIFNKITECFETLLISDIQLMELWLQTQLKSENQSDITNLDFGTEAN